MIPSKASGSALSKNANKLHKSPPPGYVNIRDILEESIPPGRFVSVVGLVKDRRSPRETSGTDWKSTLTLFDKSIENEPERGLPLTIFRPQSEIPEPDAGDIVVIVSAKVQSYRGEVSLLTNRTTAIHIYSASKIPKPPASASKALQAPLRPYDKLPKNSEHEYVSWLYHTINKDAVPDAATFVMQVSQSRNYRNKFKTLAEVKEGQFCDIIVNVVKDPFDQMGKTTLWVSDYTENEAFYKFSWDPTETTGGHDFGDPFGYTTKSSAPSRWPGPYGRLSMQVTCFGNHAEFVNEEVKARKWIRLRNVQIKYGHSGSNLEGYLREDDSAYNPGVRVDILTIEDPEEIDPKLKEAIRRKRDYEQAKRSQRKNFTDNQNGNQAGGKRKAKGQEGRVSSKVRRAQERAQKLKDVELLEAMREAKLGLNESIRCENSDQPVSAVSSILEPIPWKTTVKGEEVTLTLPFTCAKYRANVRVVDFLPRKLEQFTTWRKGTEYDCLSDNEGASDSESDGDDGDNQTTLDRYTGEKIWEWRFALLLEEADPKNKGEDNRIWALVDTQAAQLLLSRDASDLRENPSDLDQLREQLFKLWGNLEECKQQELDREAANKQRLAANQPPPTSPLQTSTNPSHHQAQTTTSHNSKNTSLSNKPFACCIHQYGIRVREEDPAKADAGDGKRWERVFGLFGTKIGS
ncbi:hypothetical protein M426DRAFT_324951 [Hypoxylon sp. CI-4A]|nr:hypothetical protein M426DRAFT_324951 [Hypoxylon sp. CI-4A]